MQHRDPSNLVIIPNNIFFQLEIGLEWVKIQIFCPLQKNLYDVSSFLQKNSCCTVVTFNFLTTFHNQRASFVKQERKEEARKWRIGGSHSLTPIVASTSFQSHRDIYCSLERVSTGTASDRIILVPRRKRPNKIVFNDVTGSINSSTYFLPASLYRLAIFTRQRYENVHLLMAATLQHNFRFLEISKWNVILCTSLTIVSQLFRYLGWLGNSIAFVLWKERDQLF